MNRPRRRRKPRRKGALVNIGVLSDTHGYLDDRIAEWFAGVEHILHAGDVGPPGLLRELERIAPVTAVSGNTDGPELGLPHTVVLELDRIKFLVHHIVEPHWPGDPLRERLAREQPHLVVFGHTHRPFWERIGNRWFLNPGYSGLPKPAQERSVVILETGRQGIVPRFLTL